jgi:hypothetical protein
MKHDGLPDVGDALIHVVLMADRVGGVGVHCREHMAHPILTAD